MATKSACNTEPRIRRPHLAAAAVILAAVLAVFRPLPGSQFLFDDELNIQENPYIRMDRFSANQILRAMVQDKFQLRPLSNLSFALDHYLHGGLDPVTMRWENAALHAAAACLLYLFLFEFIGPKGQRPARDRALASALAALLWALHPAHAQAVSYIVQRQTVLATLGLIAAALFYLEMRAAARAPARAAWAAATLAALVLAAGSKEIGWTGPIIIVLLALADSRRGDAKISRKAAIGLGIAGAAVAAVFVAVLIASGILSAYLDSYKEMSYGPGGRLLTEARVVAGYLVTMVLPLPSRLALDHDVAVSTAPWRPLSTLPALALVAAILAGAIASWRRRPLLAFLGLGFLLSLAPESTFIPVELAYDHRIYLASLFVLPPLAAWLALNSSTKRAAAFLLAAALLCGLLARERAIVFSTPGRVWTDAAKKSPGLARPFANLCAARVKENPRAALGLCDRALALAPGEVMPLVNKGVAFMAMGEKEKAGQSFREAAARHPGSALAFYNLGSFIQSEGDLEGAIINYRRAIALDRFHRDARLQLGILLVKTNKPREAVEELALLTRLYPDYQPAFSWLGLAAAKSGDCRLARQARDLALQTGPPNDGVYLLEEVLRKCGR